MNSIDAIYRDGVFEPLEPVSLAENQQVRLHLVQAPSENALDWSTWFKRVRERQQAIAQREGTTFDSAVEIAKDRQR